MKVEKRDELKRKEIKHKKTIERQKEELLKKSGHRHGAFADCEDTLV